MIINKIRIFLVLSLIFSSSGAWAEDQDAQKKYDQSLSQDLVYRVAFGKAADVKAVLDKNADPEAKNIGGVPVLLIAVVRKDAEATGIVEALLKAGANVNAVNKDGKVAVLETVKNGRADILQILIDHHAVLGIVHDDEGKDLLMLAEERGNLDIVKILNAGLENEKDKIQGLKSEDNFIKLIQDYAFLTCANEYLNFYISSQPKDVDMVKFNNVITGNSKEIGSTGSELKSLFKMKDGELQEIQNSSRGQILEQMEYYQTNQNRTLNGVGTDSDLDNRCWKVARRWNSSKVNMEQYRANTK